MKAVPDSVIWISYLTHRDGPRFLTLERAIRQRVRLITSVYILGEVERVLTDKFAKPRRFTQLAIEKILRSAVNVEMPSLVGSFVTADPNDNPIVQTALSGKADCLITADKTLLAIRKVRDVEIITLNEFAARLSPE